MISSTTNHIVEEINCGFPTIAVSSLNYAYTSWCTLIVNYLIMFYRK